MRTVEERMIRQVVTLTESASLREALALLQRHRIRHIPVVENGRLVGILTDRDVKRATPSLLSGISQEDYDRVLVQTHVSQVMTRNPFSVTPSTSLKDATKLLAERKYGALPVVEGDRLVGILTNTDLLRAFYESLED